MKYKLSLQALVTFHGIEDPRCPVFLPRWPSCRHTAWTEAFRLQRGQRILRIKNMHSFASIHATSSTLVSNITVSLLIASLRTLAPANHSRCYDTTVAQSSATTRLRQLVVLLPTSRWRLPIWPLPWFRPQGEAGTLPIGCHKKKTKSWRRSQTRGASRQAWSRMKVFLRQKSNLNERIFWRDDNSSKLFCVYQSY